jgi:PKD domain/Bacterial Ig domain
MVCGQCPPYISKKIGIPEFTWKLIVNLSPGQGIADITSETSITAVLIPNVDTTLLHNNQFTLPILNGRTITITNPGDWTQYIVSINELEEITGYKFLSEVPEFIRNQLKQNRNNTGILSASLLADNSNNRLDLLSLPISDDSAIRKSQLPISSPNSFPIESDGSSEIDIRHVEVTLGSFQISTSQISGSDPNLTQVGISQTDPFHVAVFDRSFEHIDSIQVSFSEIGIQNSFDKGVLKISSDQNGLVDNDVFRPTQVSFTQVNPAQVSRIQKPTEISFPSSITSQQLFSSNLSHNSSPNLLTDIYNTAQTLWHTTTPIDLAFKIQDLPTGQLAEGTITSYNTNGTPKTATITIDNDANGVGWFIDTTPQNNSEFTGVDNYLQATPNSAASSKYDLLTTILHEMGHTLGIINGYSEFDKYVKGRQFTTDSFTANLTPDGSHLDTTFHPYDLMNTSLKPGVRKLPSALNLAMIDAINAGVGGWVSGVGTLNPVHLTAGALIGITNGDFTTPTTWNTAGATNIINGTATLTEQSQKLSELTQAFIIPTGAKTLQFTIKDNHLVTGDTTKTANDAFEVALLDTNTFNPLAGTSIGLNHTDSLLNIQANGTIHKSDKVTITALGNNSSIVTIDLTQITPSTQATLYFNLLGFGARTSTVTIDDVKLFTDTQPIPVTKNDTLNTNQNTPLTLDPTQLTTNDTNVSQIQVINQPTHGTLTQTPDGKFTYQPVSTYVGNDSFTYLGFGSDGQISNLATVNLTVNNLPPTIETLTIPAKINEGQNIQLAATAKDGGSSDNLTYTWNLGDGSNPITGQNIAHTYTDNGNYQVKL